MEEEKAAKEEMACQVSDENAPDGRKALGRISKRTAKSSGGLRTSSSSRLTIPNKNEGASNSNGVSKVRVFVEDRYSDGSARGSQPEPAFLEGSDEVQWKDLGTHADRIKENTGRNYNCMRFVTRS